MSTVWSSPKKPRTKDFKIGQFHGKPDASKAHSEVNLQRNLFSSQTVTITRSKDKSKNSRVRFFAYELPLGSGRDWCVDLAGYDQDHNLYLIELKGRDSREKIEGVVDQINRYACVLCCYPKVREGITAEFRTAYHFPSSFRFREVKQAILAPKEFFKNKARPKSVEEIEFLFIKEDKPLEEGPAEGVDLRVAWRRRR